MNQLKNLFGLILICHLIIINNRLKDLERIKLLTFFPIFITFSFLIYLL